MTWREFERGIKPPVAPIQTTELGEEPNYAHPGYLAEVMGYEEKVNQARMDALIVLGIDVEIDKPALARFRDRSERLGIVLDADDHLVYVKHLCVTTDNDMANLMSAIMGVSIPTEEKISVRAEEFKSAVEAQ